MKQRTLFIIVAAAVAITGIVYAGWSRVSPSNRQIPTVRLQRGRVETRIFAIGDLVGGSFVRSARAVGQNPDEMEWVRERMTEVSGYLAARPMLEGIVQQTKTLKEQAESYRGQPGYTDEQIA